MFSELSAEECHECLTLCVKEATDSYIVRDADKIIGGYCLKRGSLKEVPRKPKKLADYGHCRLFSLYLHV